MRELAVRDSYSPEVQGLAIAVNDPYALDYWLRQVWEIVPDPIALELVRTPSYIIGCRRFAGDCDDAATLAGSVCHALAIPSLLVAVRMNPTDAEFSHVFLRVPAYQLDIDPIVPVNRLPIRYTEAIVLPL